MKSAPYILYFAVFTLVVGLSAVVFFGSWMKMLNAASWPMTQGTVTEVEKQNTSRSIRTRSSYEVTVSYSFDLNGSTHKGKQSTFFDVGNTLLPEYHSEADASRIESAFPKGSSHFVFYNPSNPDQNYIDRTITLDSFGVIGWASVAVVAVIIGGAWYYFYQSSGLGRTSGSFRRL